ncbi:MAG: amino acid permease [Gemmataceae bacterium]|nr:amino acid permease [Gemmataceae bacterium]
MSADASAPGFQRKLGLFDSTMLVAGTMIGSGIFVVSASAAQGVGSSGWLLAVWVLTGVMTILGALSYAELAAMMPKAGGQYVYLREAYSPLWGFLYGWACFLIIQTASIAGVAVVFAKFLGVFIPPLGTGEEAVLFTTAWESPFRLFLPLPWMEKPLLILEKKQFAITAGQLVAVGVIASLSLFNCLGVQEGKTVQNILTVAKLGALAVLIVLGLSVCANSAAIAANTADPWGGVFSTPMFEETSKTLAGWPAAAVALFVAGSVMTGPLFAADAWNNVTFTAGEIKEPQRNLPRSLMLGTGLVIALYLLANLAYMAALPVQGDPDAKGTFERGIAFAKDERVGTAVFELASPDLGVKLMALAIMVSTFGCVNGMVLMGARLYYAMSADNLFFRSVGHLNRRGVPAVGLILQGLWAILLVFTGSYYELVDFLMFAVLLFYALTVAGLFVLRFRQPDAERPYKAFGYPVVPAFYILLCAALCVVLLVVKPQNTFPGLIIVLAGIPVYWLWRLTARPTTSGA